MEPWMLVVAAGILLAPFVLLFLFNRADRADARGRRIPSRWTSHRR